MNDEAALFNAILAEPDNEALRLVYADLMEERGEPRAEFIRVQCSLARKAPGRRGVPALQQRERELLARHRRYWNGPLHRLLSTTPLRGQVRSRRALIRGWVYRRGFVEGLLCDAATFLEHTDLLFQLGPIQHLRLWGAAPHLDALAECPHLARLVTLCLRDNQLRATHARALAASPYLDRLEVLDVTCNGLGQNGVDVLARCPALAGRAAIHVAGNGWYTVRGRPGPATVPGGERPSPPLARWLKTFMNIGD
jgi:uncharacterized protein (TIGR02996 family)